MTIAALLVLSFLWFGTQPTQEASLGPTLSSFNNEGSLQDCIVQQGELNREETATLSSYHLRKLNVRDTLVHCRHNLESLSQMNTRRHHINIPLGLWRNQISIAARQAISSFPDTPFSIAVVDSEIQPEVAAKLAAQMEVEIWNLGGQVVQDSKFTCRNRIDSNKVIVEVGTYQTTNLMIRACSRNKVETL